jgi:hypothetical protein
MMRALAGIIFLALPVAGCAMSSGIWPVGPDTYTLTELRAPARGGLPEAQRAVLAEATGFCRQQGRVVVPVGMAPGGDPATPYGPDEFTATFRCLPPGDPAATGPRPGGD